MARVRELASDVCIPEVATASMWMKQQSKSTPFWRRQITGLSLCWRIQVLVETVKRLILGKQLYWVEQATSPQASQSSREI